MPYLIEDTQAPEYPFIQAARAAGRARGLMERANREKIAFAQRIDEQQNARADRNARLQEEDRAFDREKAAVYQRIAEQQAARAEKRGLIEDEELTRNAAERTRWEPVYRALTEDVPGVKVDPNTLDATITHGGVERKLPGTVIAPILKKHWGVNIPLPKPPKVDPAEIRGRTRYTIGEVARGSGVKMNESQVNALADALESHPEQLAALPGLLKDDATYQKNAKQHEELVKALSGATVPEVEKLNEISPLVAASPLGFLIQRLRMQRTPRVLALVNDAETPSVQEMDVNEAKDKGYGIITQKNGGYLLDGKPIAAPAAPAPLLQRLFQGGQGASQAAPAAPSDVVTRTLRDGTTVRVRKAADGTWQEVE